MNERARRALGAATTGRMEPRDERPEPAETGGRHTTPGARDADRTWRSASPPDALPGTDAGNRARHGATEALPTQRRTVDGLADNRERRGTSRRRRAGGVGTTQRSSSWLNAS